MSENLTDNEDFVGLALPHSFDPRERKKCPPLSTLTLDNQSNPPLVPELGQTHRNRRTE